jgi:hypothetical protein
MDGVAIKQSNDIIDVRDSHKVGDVIKVVVERDGKEVELDVKIADSADFIDSETVSDGKSDQQLPNGNGNNGNGNNNPYNWDEDDIRDFFDRYRGNGDNGNNNGNNNGNDNNNNDDNSGNKGNGTFDYWDFFQ